MALRFRTATKKLGLDPSLTPYCLRHSAAVRQIRANTPLRLIAYALDTSVTELERTYARYLGAAADDLRAGLLADRTTLPTDNVVPLAR